MHKLELYRLAVQHPLAEAAFLQRVYARHDRGKTATLLREDFAGGAAIAATWVQLHPDHRAMGLDKHRPTLHWAQKRWAAELGERSEDLQLVESDVRQVTRPRVHIVAAMNFGIFELHERKELLRYLKAVRESLLPGGVLVADVFGGPGALRVSVQKRKVKPEAGEGIKPFVYHWDQRGHDAASGMLDCRIHFELAEGRLMRDAFRYRWRLWTPRELHEAMDEAGFAKAETWCDRYDAGKKRSDGVYRVTQRIEPREDFVAYVAGVR